MAESDGCMSDFVRVADSDSRSRDLRRAVAAHAWNREIEAAPSGLQGDFRRPGRDYVPGLRPESRRWKNDFRVNDKERST